MTGRLEKRRGAYNIHRPGHCEPRPDETVYMDKCVKRSINNSEEQPPVTVIDSGESGIASGLSDLWKYRELFAIFVWRDLKVRYKQTIIGIAWAWLQPMMLVIVYSIFFGYLARFPSGDFPYPVFILSGLVVWQFFARACSDGTNALINNSQILSRLYFPRLFLPISSVVVGLADFGAAFVVLILLLIYYGIAPGWPILAFPVILFLLFLLSSGAAIWLSALNAVHRDFGLVIPVVLQIGFFVSPVIYSLELVPARFHWLYNVNPMVGFLEATRWSLGGLPGFPDAVAVTSSLLFTFLMLMGGWLFFRHNESTAVDRA